MIGLAYLYWLFGNPWVGGATIRGEVWIILLIIGFIIFLSGSNDFLSEKKSESTPTERDKKPTPYEVKELNREKTEEKSFEKEWEEEPEKEEKNKPEQQTPKEKLKELQEMKDESLITEEDYERKKKEILDDF